MKYKPKNQRVKEFISKIQNKILVLLLHLMKHKKEEKLFDKLSEIKIETLL